MEHHTSMSAVSSEHQYLPTTLHGITSQKTVMFRVINVRTSNLSLKCAYFLVNVFYTFSCLVLMIEISFGVFATKLQAVYTCSVHSIYKMNV